MKVGNRAKICNREQRMQARFERLVAKVGELEKENASLRFQVKSNKEVEEEVVESIPEKPKTTKKKVVKKKVVKKTTKKKT